LKTAGEDMEKIQYKDFKILVESPERVIATTVKGKIITSNVSLDPLRRYTISVFTDWLLRNSISQREELVVLGSNLYKALFEGINQDGHAGEISRFFKADFDDIKNDPSQALRLMLEFKTRAGKLGEMPWEYIYYPDGDDENGFFVGGNARLVLTRHVPHIDEDRFKNLQAQAKKVRVLIVTSEPEDRNELDTSVINRIRRLDSIDVKRLPRPNKDNLKRLVNDFKPHIFHFIGHGRFIDEKDHEHGELAFVDEKNQTNWVPDVDLAYCFESHQPHLIFLQACEGARSDSYDTFKSVALQLVRSKVPAVIAMQFEIENDISNKFAQEFYKSLGEGKPIEAAVQDGRIKIGTDKKSSNFSTRAFGSPVVYLSLNDMILIGGAEARGEPSSNDNLWVTCPCKNREEIKVNKFCRVCGEEVRVCEGCKPKTIRLIKSDEFCDECGWPRKKEITNSSLLKSAGAPSNGVVEDTSKTG
jgi:CHAT domain